MLSEIGMAKLWMRCEYQIQNIDHITENLNFYMAQIFYESHPK